MTVKIGCDPEVFVKNPNTRQFVCAHNMIPGTKAEPHRVPNGAVQVDGMALEFNIDPAETREQFVGNVQSVFKTLEEMVPGYNVIVKPTAQFTREVFEASPDVAKELGCEPDYNAYTGEKNIKPNNKVMYRTASGHVHIGWTDGEDPFGASHFEDCRLIVRECDATLGIMSTLFDHDKRRRNLYGKPGAFRPKSYGVEYRVLSNQWLNSPELMGWVFDTVQHLISRLEKGLPTIASQIFPDWAAAVGLREWAADKYLGATHLEDFSNQRNFKLLEAEGFYLPKAVEKVQKKAA